MTQQRQPGGPPPGGGLVLGGAGLALTDAGTGFLGRLGLVIAGVGDREREGAGNSQREEHAERFHEGMMRDWCAMSESNRPLMLGKHA